MQNIPESKIKQYLNIAKDYKIKGYEEVAVDREKMALAVQESEAGIIVRFTMDNQWYRDPIEPLRRPTGELVLSGHLVTLSNMDGMSYRIANTWSGDWASGGTAYGHLTTYQQLKLGYRIIRRNCHY